MSDADSAVNGEYRSAFQSSLPSLPGLSDAAYREIRDLVYERFGINLTEQKRSLIVGRLQKVLRARKLQSFEDYLAWVRADESGDALAELVNRISTNHTFFYREPEHFDYLKSTVLPAAIAECKRNNDHDLRVWCAGCSTGEEAYLLAILVMDALGSEYRSWQAGVLATDVSQDALAFAQKGVYPDDRMKNLPEPYRKRYFRKLDDGWHVSDSVKQEVTFRRFNLMTPQFPFRKPFHAVFCRNVMIYFDQETRRALARRFHRHMKAGSYLFIGHSESLGRSGDNPFTYVRPAVYRRDD